MRQTRRRFVSAPKQQGTRVKIQAWMIKSWPTFECYLPAQADLPTRLRHMQSHVRDADAGAPQGETVWLGEIEGQRAAMAWEWVEFRAGVVMLADPNSIVTNLRFVDDQQAPVAALSVLVALNRIVHGLPWQQAVCRMLRARRLPMRGEAADDADTPIATVVPARVVQAVPSALLADFRPVSAAGAGRAHAFHPARRRGDRHFGDEERRAA